MASKELYTVQPGSREPIWRTSYCDGEECEWLYDYSPGGLCPVLIGDVLSGRAIKDGHVCSYEVVGKLGHGSYSTVWLTRKSQSDECWALKILTHRHSTSDNSERRISDKLGKLDSAFFYTHEPTQREFLCLAIEPRGCSLRARLDAGLSVPHTVSLITAFVKGLTTKLLDLHDAGVKHGDISPGNVAFPAHDYAFTEAGLQDAFGEDLKSYVEVSWHIKGNYPQGLPQRPPNLPEYIVMHGGQLCTSGFDIGEVDFLDFGEAYDTPSKTNPKGTRFYCAPETEHGSKRLATAKSDLWSLGCVIFYGITEQHLLSTSTGIDLYFKADHETQVSLVDDALQSHVVLEHNPGYRQILAQIIQSLVRVNPKHRDPKRATELLKELEKCTKEMEFPDTDTSNSD